LYHIERRMHAVSASESACEWEQACGLRGWLGKEREFLSQSTLRTQSSEEFLTTLETLLSYCYVKLGK